MQSTILILLISSTRLDVTQNTATSPSPVRYMPLMRTFLTFIVLFLSESCFGQSAFKYTLTFKLENYITSDKIKTVDTAYVFDINKNLKSVFKGLAVVDGVVKLEGLDIGEYKIVLKCKDFTMPDCPILVCDKCQNSLVVVVYPKSKKENPWLFTSMQVWPHYKNGKKDLKADFFSKLDNAERTELSSFSRTFSIDFIVLKSGKIFDIQVFDTFKVPDSIKQIILKGISGLTNWETAMVNGQYTDGKYSLKAISLFED